MWILKGLVFRTGKGDPLERHDAVVWRIGVACIETLMHHLPIVLDNNTQGVLPLQCEHRVHVVHRGPRVGCRLTVQLERQWQRIAQQAQRDAIAAYQGGKKITNTMMRRSGTTRSSYHLSGC